MPKNSDEKIALIALIALAAWIFIGLPIIYSPEAVGNVRDWLTKDAAGFFTFWLVLVGIGQAILFFFQLSYMRKSMGDAAKAAEAAKAAAETAREQVAITKTGIFDLERAYLSVNPTQLETRFVHQANQMFYQQGDPEEIVLRLFVHNTGRTSAFMTKVYGEFSHNPPVGDEPVYRRGWSTIIDISVAASERDTLAPMEFVNSYTGQQFFWGYVEYFDIFRNPHTSRFCAAIYPDVRGKLGVFQLAGSDGWRAFD